MSFNWGDMDIPAHCDTDVVSVSTTNKRVSSLCMKYIYFFDCVYDSFSNHQCIIKVA